MKIGFAGLGVMGAPMARHLVQAGHDVAGFNRSPDKARAWAEATNGRFAATVGEGAADADLFILCVGNDDDVREVVTAALPALTALVDQFYSEVQAMGGARWDTSSLAARLQDRERR